MTTATPITIKINQPEPPPADDHRFMFNIDQYLVDRLIAYHHRHHFTCAVETGTYKGHTTVGLAKLFPKVFTIELNPEFHRDVQPRLARYPNITSLLGHSPDQLRNVIDQFSYPLFAYLDAHWHENWPLRDELQILLTIRKPKLIMIHDFQVPGRPFGFDAYKNNPCNLDYLGDILPHDECKYAFNHRTSPHSANRGVLFIEHLLP